jgi:hypothetical protein
MNKHRERRKKTECLNHRQVQYEKALDGVIQGYIPPEYAKTRWQKLKELRG